MAPPAFALAFGVTVVAATLHGTVGIGFSIVCVPLLSLVDPSLAPVPQILLLLPLTAGMVWRERRAIDLGGVGWVLVGRLPGALLGVLFLKVWTQRALDVAMTASVLIAVAVASSGRSVLRTNRTQFIAGLISGAMSVVAAIGGPPIALLYRESPGDRLRASLAAIYVWGTLITIAARAGSGEMGWRDAQIALVLLPAVGIGLWVSGRLAGRFEGRPLRVAVLVVATLASIGLLARSVQAAEPELQGRVHALDDSSAACSPR